MDNWSEHIAKMFPSFLDKSKGIEHPLLLINQEFKTRKKMSPEKIHAVYMGMVDSKNINLEKTLVIIDRINDSNIIFDFYTYGSAQDIVERYSEKNYQINSFGKVDSEIADSRRKEADVLVLIGSSDYSQIPSELIECIATGKPILYFANSMNDTAIKVLNKYPNSLVVDVSIDREKTLITEFIMNNRGKVVNYDEVIRIIRNTDSRFIEKELQTPVLRGNLIFTGSLRKGYVEPDRIIDLFSQPFLKNTTVTFYSAGNGIETIKKCKADNIKLGKWLSRSELEEKLSMADALISIAEISGKQISSKIFDYMSFGKPIVHVYYNDNDVNLKYLKHYSDSFCIKVDDNAEEIAFGISLLLRTRGGYASWPTYDQILYKCEPNYICEEIDKWIMNN